MAIGEQRDDYEVDHVVAPDQLRAQPGAQMRRDRFCEAERLRSGFSTERQR